MIEKYPKIPGMKPDRQKRLDETIKAADQAVADLTARIAETQNKAAQILEDKDWETDPSFATIDEETIDKPPTK